MQKLYAELKDKGFEIVAVNKQQPNDTLEKINSYITDNKFSFKVVLGGAGENYTLGKAYGVSGYPTNFLVGPDGKILWSGIGYSEARFKDLLDALEKIGLK